jgi:hypothetical protein
LEEITSLDAKGEDADSGNLLKTLNLHLIGSEPPASGQNRNEALDLLLIFPNQHPQQLGALKTHGHEHFVQPTHKRGPLHPASPYIVCIRSPRGSIYQRIS